MNNFSFISLVLTEETKPAAVASLSSSEAAEPTEDKGTDGKLCFKMPSPKRTVHEALIFLGLEIARVTVKQSRNR